MSRALSRLGRRVVLARAGDFVFVTFGALAGLGTLLGFGWMSMLWVGQGLAPAHLSGLGLTGAVGIVGGSWIAALALDHRTLLARPLETLRRPAFVSWGGLAPAVGSNGNVIPALTVQVFLLVITSTLLLRLPSSR